MKPNPFIERECFEAVIQSEAKTKRRGSSDVCCALICLAKPQSTIRCTMPVDIASDYPIYRLSALLCMATYKRLSAVLYSVLRYYNRLPALLYSVWRCYNQATIQFTDYPLSSIRRCYKRLSAVLYSVSGYYKRLSNLPTIQSTVYPL